MRIFKKIRVQKPEDCGFNNEFAGRAVSSADTIAAVLLPVQRYDVSNILYTSIAARVMLKISDITT